MEKDSLYLSLKNRLCEMIYKGIYQDGENIPPERVLAEELKVSRVTVRKALDLLEKDGIIERVQGSGTLVRLGQKGYKGAMDIIALLAPAKNPFFASFIDHFQKNADENNSLVLFMQNPQGVKMEDSLFKLYQKGIRNVVIWLEDMKLSSDYIRRLRGLGMNMVFFDSSIPSYYADCVLLDNKEAIVSLYNYLRENQCEDINYIGWDNLSLSSVKERENAFKAVSKKTEKVFHISWEEKNTLLNYMKAFIEQLNKEEPLPQACLCGDGELGIALKKAFIEQKISTVQVVCIDDLGEAEELGLSVYSQLFSKLACKVYECLACQNKYSRKWKASIYTVKGQLIRRQ